MRVRCHRIHPLSNNRVHRHAVPKDSCGSLDHRATGGDRLLLWYPQHPRVPHYSSPQVTAASTAMQSKPKMDEDDDHDASDDDDVKDRGAEEAVGTAQC